MTDPEEIVRTQTSLRERQRQWLKLVADLATWRIQNDPAYEPEDTSSVSMAEVLRVTVDERIKHECVTVEGDTQVTEDFEIELGLDPDEYVFFPPNRAGETSGRIMEIWGAMKDVSIYGEQLERRNPMEEMPDTRTHPEDLAAGQKGE